jgi:hypothetical protein
MTKSLKREVTPVRINIGDSVTYNDIPGDPASFLRTGVVEAVLSSGGGTLLTLRHPERVTVRWTEWYRADSMTVTRAA